MVERRPAIVKSAARAMDILEFVVKKSAKPPTFKTIQNYIDIPKSSLSNLLQELMNRGYLQCDLETKAYYAGLNLIQLSAICLNKTNISQEIWLGTKKLSDELGETTHAAVLDGRFAVYIAKHQGVKDCSVVTSIGHRLPAHATAVGKVLLAAMPPELFWVQFEGIALERFTTNTICGVSDLRKELDEVSRNGYAIDNQEIIPGGVCVGAPIFDKSNTIIASISASVPAMRATSEQMFALIQKVLETARYTSMRLGNNQNE